MRNSALSASRQVMRPPSLDSLDGLLPDATNLTIQLRLRHRPESSMMEPHMLPVHLVEDKQEPLAQRVAQIRVEPLLRCQVAILTSCTYVPAGVRAASR